MSGIFDETIAAIATPLGVGGVGIVRISGKKSLEIAKQIFVLNLKSLKVPDFKPNKFYHGWIIEKNSPLDEVIVLYFQAPQSFTGEDVIEIQSHGGINVVKNILKLCLKSGARMAERGEFSKRAFVNGKIDLSKAEAVLDIIHSRTDKFSHAAAGNLAGNLALKINALRAEVLELLSVITAAIDFPEEVAEPESFFVQEKLEYFNKKIEEILNSANSSNLMRNGLKVALAGKPNVGKSSIFNALLDMERAIVTEIPGTTRDIIQESLDINGIPIILTDTAGIRELNSNSSSDYIESIGIDISKNCIENADLILFVTDSKQGITTEDEEIFNLIKHKKVIKISSKSDLIQPENNLKKEDTLYVSAKNGTGLDLIKNEISKNITSEGTSEDFCTNVRQQECLTNAKEAFNQALQALEFGEIQDLISIDIKTGLLSLGEIVGEVVTEEIIDNIFNNFCIGK